ncbi:hypothetical protein J1N35_044309 [Gossypium stocksii]|uniref:Uncharacterized protein n=1 Tax=Gossypium stocksii TaxID=47602 RepID=A0A9D3ZFV8_9ROSI|nr:hypothetical protein J1N35_044309 [Gossypium stocksii]
MGVCGYTPFVRSFKAFSAKTLHLALNLGVDIKVITGDELAIGKETGHRLDSSHKHKYEIKADIGIAVDDAIDVANGFDGSDTGFGKWV